MVLLGERAARVPGEYVSDARALRLESYLASLLEATTFHAATEVLLLRSRARCICCIARLLSTLLFRGSTTVRRGEERPPVGPPPGTPLMALSGDRIRPPLMQAVKLSALLRLFMAPGNEGSTALMCRCESWLSSFIEIFVSKCIAHAV